MCVFFLFKKKKKTCVLFIFLIAPSCSTVKFVLRGEQHVVLGPRELPIALIPSTSNTSKKWQVLRGEATRLVWSAALFQCSRLTLFSFLFFAFSLLIIL